MNYTTTLSHTNSNPFCTANHQSLIYSAHIHRNYEIVLVREGTLKVKINRTVYTVHAGQAIFIEPFEPHSYDSEQPNACTIVEFLTDLYPPFFEWLQELRVDHRIADISDTALAQVTALTSQNLSIIDRTPQSLVHAHAILVPICHAFIMQCSGVRDSKKYDDDFLRALTLIDDNITQELSLTSVAKQLGIRAETLSRKFSEKSDMTFLHYVQYLRIYHAIRLLTEGNTIGHAAMNAGFGSIRNFNRVFLKLMGCTPSEYLVNNPADPKLL